MDERFPRYFLIAAALYALSFLLMMGFLILPALQAGLAGYAEFYLYLLLTLLPLLVLSVYTKTPVGKNHVTAFRLFFVASTFVLSMVFLFIVSPLI